MITDQRCDLLASGTARCLLWSGAWPALWVTVISCGYPELPAICGDPDPVADGTGYLELTSPSCAGLAATCGPGESASCCEAAMVPSGRFYRGCDKAADEQYKDMQHPATVSTFVLDRFEVTVGRFRTFVNAGGGTQSKAPAAATGAHPGLSNSGWDSTWNAKLSVDIMTLESSVKCNPQYQTWTDAPGLNENKPMNCVDWYEAMAFCIWDGGFLPTEAEWNFAASGGSEHRAYPWSVPASSTIIDCGYANYQISDNPAMYCTNGGTGGVNRVGSESPTGDGKWGHSDLAGNVFEWTLDWYAAVYSEPCADCANVTMSDSGERVLRGGSLFNDVSSLRSDYRLSHGPSVRANSYGWRCARSP